MSRDIPPLRLQVTNSGRGNSANSPVNNFRVDTYITINSAGALKTASCIQEMGELPLTQCKIRGDILLDKNHQYYKR